MFNPEDVLFAPEDVFKTTPLPHGYYWPSQMNQHHDNVGEEKSQVKNDKNFGITPVTIKNSGPLSLSKSNKNSRKPALIHSIHANRDKENMNPVIKTVCKENVSTSVEDLIRDIDDNLCVDPVFSKPTPASKAQVDKLLSVSDNSDTSPIVLSPGSLNYYMKRFKNSQPTHPSNRANSQCSASTPFVTEADAEDKPSEHILSSSDCSNDTLTLDTSSYLDRILSSDDSTEWNLTPRSNVHDASHHGEQSDSSDSNGVNELQNAAINPNQMKNMSFIENLTGKTFSELSQLVPKEVINPANESEDILYQWRLKRHIADAKNSTPVDDAYTRVHEIPLHISGNDQVRKFCAPSSVPINVSREIQTDAEKRESSCQANISTALPLREGLDVKENLKVKMFDNILNQAQDSCSDFSISSVSTDDLTNISDLEEEDELLADNVVDITAIHVNQGAGVGNKTVICSELCEETETSAKQAHDKELIVQKKFDANENNFPFSHITNDISNEGPAHQCAKTSDIVDSENKVNVEELLSYLDNIRDSFDDELLNVFIERYQSVLDKMTEIENEINRRCYED